MTTGRRPPTSQLDVALVLLAVGTLLALFVFALVSTYSS